ncbi:MAG: hypothetical protein PHS59_06310 [Paludibacter sp.]|nr:hypothetical protein [Paludibacter sp.]
MKIKNHNTSFLHFLKKNMTVIIKWFIFGASYSFLIYKLLTFQQYSEIMSWWKNVPVSYLGWLGAVFILLPVNWCLESLKWKMLVSNTEKLPFKTAFLSVLAGISSGFFTPNRVGEMVGRVLYLKPENRKSGIMLSVLNSISQNIIMAAFGIPAFVLFLWIQNKSFSAGTAQYLILILFSVSIFIFVFFYLRKILKGKVQGKIIENLKIYINCIAGFSARDIVEILSVTILRYFIFCIQFYFMLRFFGVELTEYQALFAIPSTYLLVTFTPSLAFSEAAVRSSYAVLIIAAISPQEVQIILAGVGIWVVNFVIPMLVGSILLLKKESIIG